MSDGLTIKERIALLNKKENADKDAKPAESSPKVGKLNIPQQKSAAQVQSSGTPPPEIKAGGTIADRVAAMKVKSAPESAEKSLQRDVPAATSPAKPDDANKVPNSGTDATEGAGEEPKTSIADRIAAMKSKPANESLPPAVGVKPTPNKFSNKFPIPVSTPPPVAPSSSTKDSKLGEEATPKRMSIADRLAALQSAEKADEDKHRKIEGDNQPQRRLTNDKMAFAQQLNLGGLMNPGGVHPKSHVPGHRIPGQAIPGMAVNDDEDIRSSIICADGTASRRNSTSTDGDIRHVRNFSYTATKNNIFGFTYYLHYLFMKLNMPRNVAAFIR